VSQSTVYFKNYKFGKSVKVQ